MFKVGIGISDFRKMIESNHLNLVSGETCSLFLYED